MLLKLTPKVMDDSVTPAGKKKIREELLQAPPESPELFDNP